MNLLIISQKVDKNDPILGFFHRWIEEFAKHCEKVTVICLGKGEYNLPENVKVLSLGKPAQGWSASGRERFLEKFLALINFYKYIWRERKNYETIFVHMNQEYVLLGGLFWKIFGKKLYLWRNHLKGSFFTRLAIILSDKVFCTSPQSFTARFKKTRLMPVGIDTDFFQPNSLVQKKPNSIIFLGRIAPVKNVDVFIEVLSELKKDQTNFSTTIAGSALPQDKDYEQEIRNKVFKYGLAGQVNFVGSVTQAGALKLYQEHELYVNLTPAGSLDKTLFEAMACGLVVASSNQALGNLAEINNNLCCKEGNIVDTKEKLLNLLQLGQEKRVLIGEKLRQYVIWDHSLRMLVESVLKD